MSQALLADTETPFEEISRREQGKQDRRERILVVAETLVRKTGGTDFPVSQLAEHAGLSGPTPYNLFGSKSALLYALLNRSLNSILATAEHSTSVRDPVTHLMKAARNAAHVFAADPVLYQPLYRFLLGVGDVVHRPLFLERSLGYWVRALEPMHTAGLLPQNDGTLRSLLATMV